MEQSHPQVVIEKARCLEQLLHRVEQGELLAAVCPELGIEVSPERLSAWQAKYEAGGRSWAALVDGRYGHEQSMTSQMKEWLYERKRQDETLTGPELAQKLAKRFKVKISVGHVNHLLRQVGLSRQPGRPPKSKEKKEVETEETNEPVVDNAGLFFPGGRESRHGGERGSDRLCGHSPTEVSSGLNAALDQLPRNHLEQI